MTDDTLANKGPPGPRLRSVKTSRGWRWKWSTAVYAPKAAAPDQHDGGESQRDGSRDPVPPPFSSPGPQPRR